MSLSDNRGTFTDRKNLDHSVRVALMHESLNRADEQEALRAMVDEKLEDLAAHSVNASRTQ